MNLLDPLSDFVFACSEVRMLFLQGFHLKVVYSPSNYLLCFCFFCYRLLYFRDKKNPMLRQHYKIALLVGVINLFCFILYFICLNIFPIKSKLRIHPPPLHPLYWRRLISNSFNFLGVFNGCFNKRGYGFDNASKIGYSTIFCKIYLEFSRFHRKSWFEVKL